MSKYDPLIDPTNPCDLLGLSKEVYSILDVLLAAQANDLDVVATSTLKVSPTDASFHRADGPSADTVFPSNHRALSPVCFDCSSNRLGQFRGGMPFSYQASIPADHIRVVVSVSSPSKMCGVHAWRVIARMKGMKIIGSGRLIKRQRENMSRPATALVANTAIFMRHAERPNPAFGTGTICESIEKPWKAGVSWGSLSHRSSYKDRSRPRAIRRRGDIPTLSWEMGIQV